MAMKEDGTLRDHTMNATEGWETDKFKFLTGISRVWKMAPNKRWSVFYEDDTYVFWDTVFRLLENFDPDVPQYFGSPSPSIGGWFANGGPGHILSRGAMRKLVANDWDKQTGVYLGSKLQEKYWMKVIEDCCGDEVLGQVLKKHGIKLKGLWPMFNPHPLHGIPFSDRYWCQPVLSLHKSLGSDLEKLWRWSFANTQTFRPTTYRDLAVGYYNFTSLKNKDNWDNGDWDAYPPALDDPWKPKNPRVTSSYPDYTAECLDTP